MMWTDAWPTSPSRWSICRSLAFYAVGETGTLSATLVSAEGDTTREASVTWSSGDDEVATVDARGRVTAVADGTTEVTATYDSTTASIQVEVALPERRPGRAGDSLRPGAAATGWTDASNWGTDEPLSEWAGVEADDSGRVVGLSLWRTTISGGRCIRP